MLVVGELWRYPVKSMRGEPLIEVGVGPSGLDGDRRRAVVDVESGVSLSAKRYGQLLTCSAWTDPDTGSVLVGFEDGSVFEADDTRTASMLSELLDRRVAVAEASADWSVRHEFSTDTSSEEADPLVVDALATEAFHDGLPVHLLTEATLRQLTSASPGSLFHQARFRPNVVVSTDLDGFVEDTWVGEQLIVGDVTFDAAMHKTRCVMTTRPQGMLGRDVEILRTTARANQRRAGIELQTTKTGTLHVGDQIRPQAST